MTPMMPKWQSYIATTTGPMFTPEQCKLIIQAGHKEEPQQAKVGGGKSGKHDTKRRITTISWIPFAKMPEMYKVIERQISIVNLNHFMFEGVQITEPAQFTEYPKGGFYNWHMDADMNCQNEPPVRKISMTILLSNQSEFEGGDLEFMS